VFGELKLVRIPKKVGGQHRGFAFVDFVTKNDAKVGLGIPGALVVSCLLLVMGDFTKLCLVPPPVAAMFYIKLSIIPVRHPNFPLKGLKGQKMTPWLNLNDSSA